MFRRRLPRLIAVLLGLLLVIWISCRLLAEALWFQEVGYLPAYLLRLQTKFGTGAIVAFASAAFLLSNLAFAERVKHRRSIETEADLPVPLAVGDYPIQSPRAGVRERKFRVRRDKLHRSGSRLKDNYQLPLPFHWLLITSIGTSLLLTLLLFHYGQQVWNLWRSHILQPGTLPQMPVPFRPPAIGQIGHALFLSGIQPLPLLEIGLLLLLLAVLLIYPRHLLKLIAVLFSITLGVTLSANWGRVLQFFHPTTFNQTDPLFSRDISFYVFALPLWELLEFWLVGILFYSLCAVTLTYLLSGDSLSQGRFVGFSAAQVRHLCGLSGGFMLVVALSYWISRYELLYSDRGVVYGASFTDVNVDLPAFAILSLLAIVIAIFLLWSAFGKNQKNVRAHLRKERKNNRLPFPLILVMAYLGLAAIAGSILPIAVQRLVVQPNELARELPYLRYSIDSTREAFDLDTIDVQTFNPQGQLTYADLQTNNLTVRNIRLWDNRPLLQTNRQLQQIRPYYRFLDADIDRYNFKLQAIQGGQSNETEQQQVLISARELDYSAVPQAAQTWVNEHLVYTHGYGFTLSPVNRVAAGGLPYYFVKDIGTGQGTADAGELNVSNPLIRETIPIDHPRIYYGELTNTYVMTGTRVKELDFPSGEDNAYNVYDGSGGVNIGSTWRRWLFALYLKDWQMLLTKDFTSETKVLFRRDINQRIRMIAPFLTYDRDPYLVVADTGKPSGEKPSGTPNYLYWIVDAYATSDRYPYSDPNQTLKNSPLNYIRNSVKVVIDAYNGSVNFYIADPTDPVIQTWAAIFPNFFKPLDQMPAVLRHHIRYPNDLFTVQSETLLTYHMTDPRVFYNREDVWQVPTEIYGSEPQVVEPYYLIMKLPSAKTEEFVLLLPFTPQQRTNLTAWLAARSDGQNYGKSLLYDFPKELLVFGTQQIEARINQDPVISQQISLWNRQGSKAVQGNLLVIPIEKSLLYVEPLYLEAAQNSLPTLVRVIVAYGNKIVMAETLDQALGAVFKPGKPTAPAIVRPVE